MHFLLADESCTLEKVLPSHDVHHTYRYFRQDPVISGI
jgi:5-enolpyruvylshikimate-3-phosphate synthase